MDISNFSSNEQPVPVTLKTSSSTPWNATGTGLAMAVGMAIAERHLESQFRR
jgi:hypothetical protein